MNKPTVLVLLLTACGDDPSSTPDAAPAIDAEPATFACTPRGAPGAVTVETPTGAPTVQVTVIVHDPAGSVVSRSPVLAPNASTVVEVPSCGMVSIHAIDPATNGYPNILTWANVQPGDHLVHTDSRNDYVDRPLQLDVAAYPDATSYRVMAACPRVFLPFTHRGQVGRVDVDAQCQPGATAVSAIAIATTPTGTAFAIAPDTALAPTGPTTIAMPAYQPSTQTLTTTVRHADGFAGGNAGYGLYVMPAPERALLLGEAVARIDPTTTQALPALAGIGGAFSLSLISATGAPTNRFVAIQRPLATFPASIELDVNTDFLPLLDATFDATPSRPSVTWTASRTLAADFAQIRVEIPVTGKRPVQWTFITPPTPGTARLPAMPADLVPAATPRLALVSVNDLTTITSYDDARSHLLTYQLPPAAGNEALGTAIFFPGP